MWIGQPVLYRLQQPNQYDNGWRPAFVLSRNNKGFALRVFLNDQFDRDIVGNHGGTLFVNNRQYGDGVGQFLYSDEGHSIPGEDPGMKVDEGPIPPSGEPSKEIHTSPETPAAPADAGKTE